MAYTTAALIKTYLGISGSGDDAILTDMATRAQAIIDRHTGQTFEASIDTARTFDAVLDVDGRTLIFDAAICAITEILNGDGTVITSAQYVTQPRNLTPYWGVTLLPSTDIGWEYTPIGDPENAIIVTGKWAWSISASDDIVQAATRLAAWLYNQRSGSQSTTNPFASPDGIELLPSSLPRDVREILAPYVKLV